MTGTITLAPCPDCGTPRLHPLDSTCPVMAAARRLGRPDPVTEYGPCGVWFSDTQDGALSECVLPFTHDGPHQSEEAS